MCSVCPIGKRPKSMNSTASLPAVLREHLASIRTRCPSYSKRAFARRLGLSSGALSEILNGKRNVTVKCATRIADRLSLGPRDRRRLGLTPPAASSETPIELTQDIFALISEWWHYAILNLTRTHGFRGQPLWIAKRLGIPLNQAELAVQRLLKLGLLKRKGETLVRVFKNTNTSDEVVNPALRRSHRMDFELISAAFSGVPLALRDSTSITFPISVRHIAEIKRLIRRFQDEIFELASDGAGDEVYRLSMHLFPLSLLRGDLPSEVRTR